MNIKKMIAREGLVLLAFLMLFILGIFKFSAWLPMYSIFGYLGYLVVRFIIWSFGALNINGSGINEMASNKTLAYTILICFICGFSIVYFNIKEKANQAKAEKEHYQNYTYPIDLVKAELPYDFPVNPLKSIKGDMQIIGWVVEKVNDNTFLVSYRYVPPELKKTTNYRGWWWEVNTNEKIVRSVLGDKQLEKKYNVLSMDGIQNQEDNNAETNNQPRKDNDTVITNQSDDNVILPNLEGILWTGDGDKSSAILNGKEYKIGEYVDGYYIVNISEDDVMVVKKGGGKTYSIKLNKR